MAATSGSEKRLTAGCSRIEASKFRDLSDSLRVIVFEQKIESLTIKRHFPNTGAW